MRESAMLQKIRQAQDKADMTAYLEAYPQGLYRVEVLGYLEERLWQEVEAASFGELVGRLQVYLNAFPSGPHAEVARQRLRETHQLGQIRQDKRREDMLSYLQTYPQGSYRDEVLGYLEPLLWQEVEAAGAETIESRVNLYVQWFADGRHANDARQRLEAHREAHREVQRMGEEERLIAAIRQDRREADMRLYLTSYPKGRYQQEVLQALEAHLWQAIQTSQMPELETRVRVYLDTFPQGSHAEEARRRLQHDRLIATIQQYKREKDMVTYLDQFPAGASRDQVLAWLEPVLWQAVASYAITGGQSV